jgi:hypothetical protein
VGFAELMIAVAASLLGARTMEPDAATKRWPRSKTALAALLICCAGLLPDRSSAEGALAVGLPADVAKQGIAMGYALNYETTEKAQELALKRCREFQDAPQATRDLCRIVEKFNKRCLAVALDPQFGTTGLGWSVSKNQEVAEELAMEKCVDTAGRKRREFCRVTLTTCDGRK